MEKISVNREKCNNCGICAQICPVEIFEVCKGNLKVNERNFKECIECGACEKDCPQKAIILKF